MRNTFIVFLLTSSLLLSQYQIEKKDSITFGNKLWSDVELSFNNNLKYFSRPVEFSSSDWLKFAGITLATGALMTIDKEVTNSVTSNQTNFLNDFTKVGKSYGEITPIAISVIGIYGGGLVFGNDKLRTTGRILIESLVAAGITTTALKIIIGRSRPYKNEGEFKFNFFDLNSYNNSLPSGHSTVAFTISTVLSERIDNIYASIALYGLASLTAYQRIYSNNHWLSDTFLGAVIGIAAGKYFSNLEIESNSQKKSDFSFKVAPYLNPHSPGLSIQIQF